MKTAPSTEPAAAGATAEAAARSTMLGILAIVFWSTTVALSRSVIEDLGMFTAAACIYLLGGSLACIHLFTRPNGWAKFKRVPRRYLLLGGGLFVTYMLCFYPAIGLSSNRRQVVEIGIINYLWPSLTLVFSIFVLKKKARLLLIPGIMLASAGIYLAMAREGTFSLQGIAENRLLPYLLAFVGAVVWALFSNVSRKLAGGAESGATPVFLLASGLVLLLVRFAFPEQSRWSLRVVIELAAVAVFPAWLGYTFWEFAMRKGNMVLVTSLSYLTPLLSTIVTCFYLRVAAGANLWIACALVIAGAVVCKLSVVEGTDRHKQMTRSN